MRSAAAALMLATALTARLDAQRPPVPAGWTSFVHAFDDNVRADSMVGASVAVVDRGRIAASHLYGMGDRALGQPVTDRTIFHWGSITKQLTAIAIMQLRDRGKLSLDDPIVRYVPELRQVHDPYGAIDSVTIRMLLSHSAGFQNPTWPYTDAKAWEPFEPTTWNQLVAMMPYQEIHFKPGSQYSYSNPGFIYLARVIEALSGDPWESYVQKNIFAPLGLMHSYFRSTPYYLAADRSNNYTVTADSSGRQRVTANGRDFDPGITVPNGGWNAPVSDLASFAAFLLNATGGDTVLQRRYDAVLSRSSLTEMWRPVVPLSAGAPSSVSGMGLAFFIEKHGTTTFLGHTGSQAGFTAFLYFDPLTSRAVIAAFNTENTVHPSRFSQILHDALTLIL